MNDGLSFGDCAMANVARGRKASDIIHFGGRFDVECYGPDDVLKWADHAINAVVSLGLHTILDVMFDADTQTTQWFIGLVNDTPTFAAADIMTSHAGWTEFIAYSETTRPEWAPGEPATSPPITVTNATTRDYSITGTSGQIVAGMFLCSDSAINGTAGILWGEALFSAGDQTVGGGDTLRVTYTITAA